jgi:hypothetical protein
MVKVSGVPYDVNLENEYVDTIEYYLQKQDLIAELERENRHLRARMELTDERILELARECGASKVFVAGFSIAGNAKIIDFARRIVEEVSKG